MDAKTRERLERLAEKWKNNPKLAEGDFWNGRKAGQEQCANELRKILAAESTAEPKDNDSAATRYIQQRVTDDLKVVTEALKSVEPTCRYTNYPGYKEVCTKIATTNRGGYDLCQACADRRHAAEVAADKQAEEYYAAQAKPAEQTSGTFEEWWDTWRAGGRPILNQNLAQFGQEVWNAALRTVEKKS